MEFEQRVRVATPEGVDVELVVANLGSRFMATFLDWVLEMLLILALGAVAGFSYGVVAVATFLVFFGYPIAFETLNRGRTLGKLVAGTRVVNADGSPEGFVASAVRNVVRVIDILPGFYAVGTISAVATPNTQRLGDLAAGTLVVRERLGSAQAPPPEPGWYGGVALPPGAAGWDVTAVTADEVSAVTAFLDRRAQLAPDVRARLGLELATRLHAKVVGVPEHEGPERFLEYVVAAKSR